MARRRTLNDDKMAAARWEYECTVISQHALSRKYGWNRSALQKRASNEGWQKSDNPKVYEPGPDGESAFKRDLAAAVKAAYDKKLVEGLEKTVAANSARAESAKAATVGLTGRIDPDLAASPPDQPDPPKKSHRKKPPADPAAPPGSGDIIRFPGSYLPPPPAKAAIAAVIPARSRADQAAMRLHLSTLRGEVTLQQLEQLQQHDEVIADYRHLLAVFLNPAKFVEVKGLSDEEATNKLGEVSRAALRVLLPTERDTLAGAILALNKATLASIGAVRSVLGIVAKARGPGMPPDSDDGAGEPAKAGVDQMDLAALRQVKDAMTMLTGYRRENNEPPRPPPPEPLESLNPEQPPPP